MDNISKGDLINIINEWKELEINLKNNQKILKELKNKKKNLTDKLILIMKTNEIDCFDINNGKIIYTQNKIKQTINKAYLLESINKYYNNSNDKEIENITNFILDNRQIKIKENIRCKLNSS